MSELTKDGRPRVFVFVEQAEGVCLVGLHAEPHRTLCDVELLPSVTTINPIGKGPLCEACEERAKEELGRHGGILELGSLRIRPDGYVEAIDSRPIHWHSPAERAEESVAFMAEDLALEGQPVSAELERRDDKEA